MEKKTVSTKIAVEHIRYSGMYATIRQDDNLMQYKYSIYSVVFFKMENKEYQRVGHVMAFADNPLYFETELPLLAKTPVKRKENPNKNEKFFFINNTLFIDVDAFNVHGPTYIKCDLRKNGAEMSEEDSNFCLEEVWSWESGSVTNILWYDYRHYLDITRPLRDIMCNWHTLNLNRIDELIITTSDTKRQLIETMKWWETVSVDELVKKYKEVNQK